jgi:hypothetical protein
MRNRSAFPALVLLVGAGAALGQQSGTTTECKDTYGGMTCKTTQSPPTLAEIFRPKPKPDQPHTVVANAPNGLSPEAVKAFLAEEKAARDAKDTVEFIYCRQNTKGSVINDGVQKSRADVIEYTKAFCAVNLTDERCTLARSREEVQKAFAALVGEYNADPHRNRNSDQAIFAEKFAKLTKWGCMSFPDMVLPQKEGTHACPNAPDVSQPK